MLFAFSACKNDDTKHEQNSTTTSTTVNGNDDTTGTTTTESVNIFGKWVCDEIATPQKFYSEFYNPEITNTSVEMRTVYNFKEDGIFSITVSILNISEVRKEYRSLMVEAGRKNLESQGKMLTTDDVLYYENYADEVLEEICTSQTGTYNVTNNRIFYTINGEAYSETFIINGDKLTLTGSSNSDKGYPITMIKM